MCINTHTHRAAEKAQRAELQCQVLPGNKSLAAVYFFCQVCQHQVKLRCKERHKLFMKPQLQVPNRVSTPTIVNRCFTSF